MATAGAGGVRSRQRRVRRACTPVRRGGECVRSVFYSTSLQSQPAACTRPSATHGARRALHASACGCRDRGRRCGPGGSGWPRLPGLSLRSKNAPSRCVTQCKKHLRGCMERVKERQSGEAVEGLGKAEWKGSGRSRKGRWAHHISYSRRASRVDSIHAAASRALCPSQQRFIPRRPYGYIYNIPSVQHTHARASQKKQSRSQRLRHRWGAAGNATSLHRPRSTQVCVGLELLHAGLDNGIGAYGSGAALPCRWPLHHHFFVCSRRCIGARGSAKACVVTALYFLRQCLSLQSLKRCLSLRPLQQCLALQPLKHCTLLRLCSRLIQPGPRPHA